MPSAFHRAIAGALSRYPFVLAAAPLLVALLAAIYAQTWHFDFIEWDDPNYVRDNPNVQAGLTLESWLWGLTSFDMSNWNPLTWWSFQLDVSLFGLAPGPMHVVNVALHGLNCMLLFALLQRYGFSWKAALAAAAIFAVHPLHVESVAWITERKDVLSGLCLLLALLAWDTYVRRGQRRHYVLAWLLTLLGLMAKPMLMTLPGLLLILDGWPYARLRQDNVPLHQDTRLRQRCLEKIPFLALAVGSAAITLFATASGGAARSLETIGIADRLANTLMSYGMYLLKSVAPTSLSFFYPFESPDPAAVLASTVGLVAVSTIAWRCRGAILAGWLWYLLTLLPVIGLVAFGEHARADRFMYIPMIGLLLMLPTATSALTAGLPWRHIRQGVLAGAAAVAIVLLAAQAWRYTAVWRDSESLFTHALRLDPKHHVAHALLAITYERRGRAEAVLQHADAALALAPRTLAAANAAVSASNAAASLGRHALARDYLAQAMAAAPDLAMPHYNLGLIELRRGDPAAAVPHFQQAIARNPKFSPAYNNLGVAYLQLRRMGEAHAAFAEAVRLDPRNAQARRNLARFTNASP